jgi:asparagine synthase (glutamine-hydrolysing)
MTRAFLREEFERWRQRLDIPTANPTSIAISGIARAVREDGGKVLLAGDGGDELFGGYSRWMKYLRFSDSIWSRAPMSLRRAAGTLVGPLPGGLLGDIARRARQGSPLFVGSRPFHDRTLHRWLGPVALDAMQKTHPESHVRQLRKTFEERHPYADELAWMTYLSLRGSLVEDYLMRLDTMAMAESVEGRVPLLDVDLVEFALSLPQPAKVGADYRQKAMLRAVASQIVPDYILDRPKQGFCPPVAVWATQLLNGGARRRSILVEEGLVRAEAHEALTRNASGAGGFDAWALSTLEYWCDGVFR